MSVKWALSNGNKKIKGKMVSNNIRFKINRNAKIKTKSTKIFVTITIKIKYPLGFPIGAYVPTDVICGGGETHTGQKDISQLVSPVILTNLLHVQFDCFPGVRP